MTAIVDSANNRISASYDDLGRKLNVADPDRGQWTYVWDGLGRLTDQTDARRAWTGYRYDAIGRPVLRGAQGAADTAKVVVASWVYDQNGRYGTLSTVTGGTVNADAYSEGYQYDALLRPTKVAIHMPPVGNAAARDFAVGYGYDQNYGRVKARSYPSGQLVAFDYDDRGYALGEVGLLADGSRDTLYRRVNAMSVRGQVTDQTLGNDIVETAQYDASTGLSTWASSTRPPGTAATCKTASGTESYEYDSAGRLVSSTRGGVTTSFQYDADGNRIDSGGTVDAQDRLLATKDATFTYDADGRLSSVTRGNSTISLTHDTFGRLKRAEVPGHRIDYVMDPLGHRVGKKVDGTLAQGFLYDVHGRVIAQLDGGGAVISRFVYGSRANVPDYMVKGGSTYRLVTDHLGSVRLVVDASTSEVAEALDYDVWGKLLSDSQPGFQPFGFAGGLYDADTGLVHFGARDYDPVVGRWITKDPILFRGGQLNLYAYVGNDPVNNIDPSGLCVTAANVIVPLALLAVGVVVAVLAPELFLGAEAVEALEGVALAAEGVEATEGLAAAAEVAEAAEGVTVTEEGLATVTQHLAQFGEYGPNEAMLERLGAAVDSTVSGADANFYTHELLEAENMASGLSYEEAHAAALEEAGVSPYSVYHPDVIEQFPELFNDAWRAYWGL